MEKKKNDCPNKLLTTLMIVCVTLSVVILGIVSYDKFMKKDKEKCPVQNVPVENGNGPGNGNGCGPYYNINADEDYKKFSNNLKNSILNNELDTYAAMDGLFNDKLLYKVILTNKMELIINFIEKNEQDKYGTLKVADGVIAFDIAKAGPGGYDNIYFIKEDGTVGEAIPWDLLGGYVKEMVINYPIADAKNIVAISQASYQSGGYMLEPIFIDINGNIVRIDHGWDE